MPEQINQIVNLYNARFTLKQISEIEGTCLETIRQRLLKAGVKMYPKGNRRLSLNKYAFETLTPKSSYWIGMLLADGNLYKSKDRESYHISLGLAVKDRKHVEKFKKFMNSDHKISEYDFLNKTGNRKRGVNFNFSSKKIYDDLISWYIEPRKSCKEKVHPKLKLNRDFWRGMFDGDGSVGVYLNKGKLRFSMRLWGSNNVINNFKDFLGYHNIKHGKICKTKTEVYMC